MLDLNMLKEVGKTIQIECSGHVYDYGEYLDAYEFKISKDGEVIEYIYVDRYIFEPVLVKHAQDICLDCFAVLKKSAIDIVASGHEEDLWKHFDKYKSDDSDEIFKNVDLYNAYVNIISAYIDLIRMQEVK